MPNRSTGVCRARVFAAEILRRRFRVGIPLAVARRWIIATTGQTAGAPTGAADKRPAPASRAALLRGQWVEVLSAREIGLTLDASGKLEGLPFMPEMTRYCGRRVRIYRRAEKTCVEGHGLRKLRGTVLLDGLRCDGSSHDGCQRDCLMFWKEAWLRPVDGPGEPPAADPAGEEALAARLPVKSGERYVCQSTELVGASFDLRLHDVGQYLREARVGELSPGFFLRIATRVLVNKLRGLLKLPPVGVIRGEGTAHSKGNLGLRAGDRVEVLSASEIEATVGPKGRNRGLLFEPDMRAYLGGRYEVSHEISRLISEETGKMVRLTNTVALKGVVCEGLCAKNCPRSNPHFWREAWLRRVES